MVASPLRQIAFIAVALALAGCGGSDADAASDASSGVGTGGSAAGATGGGGGTTDEEGETLLDIPYVEGSEPEQRLDLYTPAGPADAKRPVVVWVHGGAWAFGDKANGMDVKVPYFNGLGYVLASVDYRLSPPPEAMPASDRVMYPLHEQDVAAALAWIHRHVAEHGGDPERVAVLGHSAGAHLTALVATDPAFLQAHGLPLSSVRCVGTFDTDGYDIPELMAAPTGDQAVIYTNAFGDDPAVWEAASPMSHVASGGGIGAFLIAKRGGPARQADQVAFHDALVGAGVTATIVDATPLSHDEVNDHIGVPGETIMTPPITEFLAGCFD